jgi:L-lysine exporter family protein LysE/ArgO
VLIIAGVLGFGTLVERLPWIDPVARYGGAAFLAAYSLLAFRSAVHGGTALDAAARAVPSWQVALLTCLALTWLNPHVYLDTVVLLGAASLPYQSVRLVFALGAVSASFGFFFSLGYGARLLQPVFVRPASWRVLDVLVGLLMFGIAVSLVRSV